MANQASALMVVVVFMHHIIVKHQYIAIMILMNCVRKFMHLYIKIKKHLSTLLKIIVMEGHLLLLVIVRAHIIPLDCLEEIDGTNLYPRMVGAYTLEARF